MNRQFLSFLTLLVILPLRRSVGLIEETPLMNCWTEQEFKRNFLAFKPDMQDLREDDLLQVLNLKYLHSNPNLFLKKGQESALFEKLYYDSLSTTQHTGQFSGQGTEIALNRGPAEQLENTVPQDTHIDGVSKETAETPIKKKDISSTLDLTQQVILKKMNSKYLKEHDIDMSEIREAFNSGFSEIEKGQILNMISLSNSLLQKYPNFYSLYLREYNSMSERHLVSLFNFFLASPFSSSQAVSLDSFKLKVFDKVNIQLHFPKMAGCVRLEKNGQIQIGFILRSVSSLDFYMSMRGGYQWYLSKIFLDVAETFSFLFERGYYIRSLELEDIGIISSIVDERIKRFRGTMRDDTKIFRSENALLLKREKLISACQLFHTFFEAIERYHTETFMYEQIVLEDCLKSKKQFTMFEKCPVIIWGLLDADPQLKEWFRQVISISTADGLRPSFQMAKINEMLSPEEVLFGFKEFQIAIIKMKDEMKNSENGFGWGYFGDLTREANRLIRETQESEDTDEMMQMMMVSNSSEQLEDDSADDSQKTDVDDDQHQMIKITDEMSDFGEYAMAENVGQGSVKASTEQINQKESDANMRKDTEEELDQSEPNMETMAIGTQGSLFGSPTRASGRVKKKKRRKSVTKVLSTAPTTLFYHSRTLNKEQGSLSSSLFSPESPLAKNELLASKSMSLDELDQTQKESMLKHQQILKKSIMPIKMINFMRPKRKIMPIPSIVVKKSPDQNIMPGDLQIRTERSKSQKQPAKQYLTPINKQRGSDPDSEYELRKQKLITKFRILI